MERMEARLDAAIERLEALLLRAQAKKRVRAVLFMSILLCIFAMMFLLNAHTPLMMDDYDYSISWSTGEPVAGLFDVIASQAAHYRLWGGRSVVHAFAQTFLWLGKPVFNIANAAMYVLFLVELYALAKPREQRFVWPVLLAAHAALFCCVPFFGTVFLWLTGACNYLWGTALALLPLLVLRSAAEGGLFARGGGWGAFAAVIGFIAGWTNENTACAVFALVLLWLLAHRICGRHVAVWQWLMLVAQGIGILVMLTAPGNFSRASGYDSGFLPLELMRRFAVATVYGVIYIGVPILIAALLSALLRAMKLFSRRGWAAFLILGAVLTSLALAASPVISDRSYTGAFALALAGALALFADVGAGTRAFDATKLAVLPLVALLMAYAGYGALNEVKEHETAWLAQMQIIEDAARMGQEEAVVNSVPSHSRFTMDIMLDEEPSQWPNSSICAVLGVSVRGE